jgi:hypothetical protein
MSRFVFVAFSIFVLGSSLAWAEPRAGDVLAQSKAAMGGAAWDNVHFIRTHAQIQTSGLSGASDALEDVRSGASVTHYELGPMKGANGFDGKTVWSQDNSGQVAVQGADDARQGAANDAYRAMRGFWYPERAAAEIVYAGGKSDGGRTFDAVRITPKGGRPFEVWVDTKTHLFDRTIEKTAIDVQTTFFSDYRNVAGKLVPFAIRSTNGEARYDTTIKVESVLFEDVGQAQAFAPPPPPQRDFGFLGGRKVAAMPFKLINNHMYIEVRLNGRGPYEFLFDTGGSNVMTPTIAHELGLKLQGALQGRGAGEKSQDVAITMVDHMEIGGAFMDRQNFASIALESFGDVEGKPITGIIGYEVFKRFVVRTDYQANQVMLIEPAGFNYSGPGVRIPFQLKDSIPTVAGDIDGVPGTFDIDTGSRATLDLMAPFVAKNNLVARYQAKVQGVNGWGVGGPARAWIVRAHRLTLGGVSVDGPVVGLSQATSGAFADAYSAGNVGAGALKRFNIVWDYANLQMFFERNAHYSEPDVFNRAGIWANLGGAGFEVIDVFAGSPAEEAGLKTGDHILAVDGRQAQRDISLPDFRSRMREAPGTKLTLDVERGGKKLQIAVTLRDLV